MMDLVVNASPLILLCKAGHIRLLEKLGRNVFVPHAVVNEVVAYALQCDGVRPLLDDAEGKSCALAHGLKPLGTAGLLVLAKRSGLIQSVKPALGIIREKGLWISDAVVSTIVKSAGE